MKYTIRVTETTVHETVTEAPTRDLAEALGSLKISEATTPRDEYVHGVHEVSRTRETTVTEYEDARSERLIGDASDFEVIREPDGDDAA